MDESLKQGIIRLWNEGKTGAEIAEIFGVTRNSVLGFVHRMRKKGYDVHQKAEARPAKARLPKPIAAPAKILPDLEEDMIEECIGDEGSIASVFDQYFSIPPSGKTLMFLNMASCRFIVSPDGAEAAIYCGKKIARRSYCKDHANLCYTPIRPAKDRFSINMRFP
jgi:hypothetical protein